MLFRVRKTRGRLHGKQWPIVQTKLNIDKEGIVASQLRGDSVPLDIDDYTLNSHCSPHPFPTSWHSWPYFDKSEATEGRQKSRYCS